MALILLNHAWYRCLVSRCTWASIGLQMPFNFCFQWWHKTKTHILNLNNFNNNQHSMQVFLSISVLFGLVWQFKVTYSNISVTFLTTRSPCVLHYKIVMILYRQLGTAIVRMTVLLLLFPHVSQFRYPIHASESVSRCKDIYLDSCRTSHVTEQMLTTLRSERLST